MPPLPFLLRDAVAEYGLVEVGGDAGEGQALELGRVERLDFRARAAVAEILGATRPCCS
ncbi:hypothetical protein ACH4CE_33920 [Streptomyces gelaticus]|uniref:hypothetical protein n=1 Tax=Streptomyces gelaticus TaxID=285446 RepID=UPI00378996DF